MRRLAELGPGLFRYAVPGVIPVNAGIVVGDDGACVIDTGTTQDEAEAILGAVRQVTSLPLRYVINTHHHGDHSFGNAFCRPALLVGHQKCRLRLLGDAGMEHREMFARLVPMAAEQIRAVPLAPPEATFSEATDLFLGQRRLALRYHGLAHTDNDISIRCDEVVFAGDLIEESAPPVVADGYPGAWGATLRAMLVAADGAERFLPGHGEAVDRGFVEWQAAAFEDLARACESAGQAGAEAAMALVAAATRAVLGPQLPLAIQKALDA